MYKRTRKGERKLQDRRTRKYDDLPKPGRNGPSVVSNSFVRYPSDLQGAPYVPKKHIGMYRRISLGRDRICPLYHSPADYVITVTVTVCVLCNQVKANNVSPRESGQSPV